MFSFVIASIIFAMTPGMATLYVFNNSLTYGRRSGILSSLGVMVGGSIYNIIASIGLASVIVKFPFLFNGIKIIGICYLVYVGVSGLLNKSTTKEDISTNSAFKKGIITNLANPKVMLFFITFIPQFLTLSDDGIGVRLFFLGAVYLLIELIWFSTLAILTSTFTAHIQRLFEDKISTISSIIYILMALLLAFK